MEVLTSPKTYDFHPERAWERLKTRVRKPKELAVLMEVAAWREQEAQSRDVPRSRVLKDDAVGDIATHAPTSLERLANLRSLPKGFDRSKWGADIVAAVQRGLARDPATLPKIEKPRGNSNGAATVELLKVLLRMTSERHAVASKVIATVDDLEQIAADDNADVAALHGWRRELFGEAALSLKHGRLALAIEKGRVVRVDRNQPLPLEFDADRALVRLHRGAKLAVIIGVEPHGIAQAERRGRAGIRAILAFADPLHRDALGAEADGDRTEILRDIVDELAVGGQIENLLIENPVVPDLRAEQDPRALHRRHRSPSPDRGRRIPGTIRSRRGHIRTRPSARCGSGPCSSSS